MMIRDRALELVRRALESFEDSKISVASLVRMCIRVANIRNDALGLAILRMETVDLQIPKSGRVLFPEQVQELSAFLPYKVAHEKLFRASEARHARMTLPRKQDEEEQMWGGSVALLESALTEIEQRIAALDRDSERLVPQDTTNRHENEKIRLMLERRCSEHRQLLERTKAFLFDFLIDTEAELERGQTFASVFEVTRRYVDESLAELAPTVTDELRAGEERLMEGTPPALSQALMSCRRVLKALADAVYPPSLEPAIGADGKARKLGEDQYINRLLEYAMNQTGSRTANEVFQSGLDALGRRLTAVNALASKGVHANVPLEEAQACFAQTYLLSAEILRLRDHTSMRLTLPEPEE